MPVILANACDVRVDHCPRRKQVYVNVVLISSHFEAPDSLLLGYWILDGKRLTHLFLGRGRDLLIPSENGGKPIGT